VNGTSEERGPSGLVNGGRNGCVGTKEGVPVHAQITKTAWLRRGGVDKKGKTSKYHHRMRLVKFANIDLRD